MENAQHKYEVYIEKSASPACFDSITAQWIWRKLNAAGLVLVHGSHHASLEACFASARKHRETFGDAPITINLRKDAVCDAPHMAAEVAAAVIADDMTSSPLRKRAAR